MLLFSHLFGIYSAIEIIARFVSVLYFSVVDFAAFMLKLIEHLEVFRDVEQIAHLTAKLK
jgi:hypothetical protein